MSSDDLVPEVDRIRSDYDHCCLAGDPVAERIADTLLSRIDQLEDIIFGLHGPTRRGGGPITVECWDNVLEDVRLLPEACGICRSRIRGSR